MGFEAPQRDVAHLKFTGELAGLEVWAKVCNESTFRAAARLAELSDAEEITLQDAQIIVSMFDAFGRALVAWNLETTDQETGVKTPVPATRDGIDDQKDAFIIQIIMGWLSTVQLNGSGRSYEDARIKQEEINQQNQDAEIARSLVSVPLPG